MLHEQDSKRNGETVEHLLLHCQVAQELWNMVCTLFGVHWVMLRSVVELVANWSGKFNRLWIKVFWRIILHCLMWLIWRERNAHTFEGIERSIHELKLLAFTFFFFYFAWLGKCFRCFFFHFFTWYPWFLYLLCYLIFSMLLLAHGLCDHVFVEIILYTVGLKQWTNIILSYAPK